MSKQTAALSELSAMAHQHKAQQFPGFPAGYIPKTKYKDTTANELTKSIIDFLRFSGHFAARINSQGQYNERLAKWTKSGSTRGMSDIVACIYGRFVAIEVKIGKDRQSDVQAEIEEGINKAGGYYFIAKDFDSFHEWYKDKKKGRAIL